LKEIADVKYSYSYLSLVPLTLFSISLAYAQTSADINIGFGGAHNSAAGGGLENATSTNAFAGCVVSSADPTCQATPGMSSFFMGIGGDVMLKKQFGVGADFKFQPGKSDYGPLQYRQSFYTFDGIYAPINGKRAVVKIAAGLGGARTAFSFTQTDCVGTAVCSTQAQPVGNSSHFQLHAGVGLQYFFTDHIFVRPQFDMRYVPGFTDQFGSNWVPEGTVWIGYSFGDRGK
jgi:hypothetical protein